MARNSLNASSRLFSPGFAHHDDESFFLDEIAFGVDQVRMVAVLDLLQSIEFGSGFVGLIGAKDNLDGFFEVISHVFAEPNFAEDRRRPAS